MKFVIRVMDEHGNLLGWLAVTGVGKPGGRIAAEIPVVIPIIRAGVPRQVSVEWADLDIARAIEVLAAPDAVKPGQSVALNVLDGSLWRIMGEANVARPSVEETEPVVLTVPVGELASQGQI